MIRELLARVLRPPAPAARPAPPPPTVLIPPRPAPPAVDQLPAGATLIDLRPPASHPRTALPGALPLPADLLFFHLSELGKGPVVLYGPDATPTAERLIDVGIDARVLRGTPDEQPAPAPAPGTRLRRDEPGTTGEAEVLGAHGGWIYLRMWDLQGLPVRIRYPTTTAL